MSGQRPSPRDYQQPGTPYYGGDNEQSDNEDDQQRDYHPYSPQIHQTPYWQQSHYPSLGSPQPAQGHHQQAWSQGGASRSYTTYDYPQQQEGFDPDTDHHGQGYQASNQPGAGHQGFDLTSQHQRSHHDPQRPPGFENSMGHSGHAYVTPTHDQALGIYYDSPDDVEYPYDDPQASRYIGQDDDAASYIAQTGSYDEYGRYFPTDDQQPQLPNILVPEEQPPTRPRGKHEGREKKRSEKMQDRIDSFDEKFSSGKGGSSSSSGRPRK